MSIVRQGRSSSGRTSIRVALAGALVTLALGVSPVLADPSADGGTQASFAAVRAATARFHDLSAAEDAGYGVFPGCFEHAEGGMGEHFVRFDLVGDAAVDPRTPEALVYEPLRGGGHRLVAVEYVVIAEGWDATHDGPPSVLGHDLEFVPEGNEFGLPDFYELHVWLWQPNQLGMFHEWNPAVSCDAAAS